MYTRSDSKDTLFFSSSRTNFVWYSLFSVSPPASEIFLVHTRLPKKALYVLASWERWIVFVYGLKGWARCLKNGRWAPVRPARSVDRPINPFPIRHSKQVLACSLKHDHGCIFFFEGLCLDLWIHQVVKAFDHSNPATSRRPLNLMLFYGRSYSNLNRKDNLLRNVSANRIGLLPIFGSWSHAARFTLADLRVRDFRNVRHILDLCSIGYCWLTRVGIELNQM